MECTQKLECTQDLYCSQIEKEYPDQVAFLGICGKTYPVKKGPNKIGRDPQTCNIVLNLGSVSRQHAVINVLHKNQIMLMDLDSANKTKLSGKSLQPYIPNALKNGDTVQFGEIFGIFRLLEEEDELPQTQALNIPDTPIQPKPVSRCNTATIVPESPDVSDKDDSFIMPSQQKLQVFKNTDNNHFVKPGKLISIQPIGGNKIDNIFWKSSKKSTSINLDDSTDSHDNSSTSALACKENENNNIHEMDTQAFFASKPNESGDFIYAANTQLPIGANASPSIYTVNTQLPHINVPSPSIYSAETQIPVNIASPIQSESSRIKNNEPSIDTLETQMPAPLNLPDVCKVNNQRDMQHNIFTNNKDDDDDDLYHAETQIAPDMLNKSHKRSDSNVSEEKILFDEVDEPDFDNLESQAILTEDFLLPSNRCLDEEISEPLSQITKPQSSKKCMVINSDDSTDCEDIDILPTQKISELKPKGDDDETDCEDEMIELNIDKTKSVNPVTETIDLDLADAPTQVLDVVDSPLKPKNLYLEDMPTQVLKLDDSQNNADADKISSKENIDFEDLPTQVLVEDLPQNKIDSQDVVNFKVPFKTVVKAKKKDVSSTPKIQLKLPESIEIEDDEQFYQNTQELFDDLCSQRVSSPGTPSKSKSEQSPKSISKNTDPLKSPQTSKEKHEKLILDKSFSDVDSEENINNFVSNLSSQDIKNVIGVETAKPTREASGDSSDTDATPKKAWIGRFLNVELPNSQEITAYAPRSKEEVTESSESEDENNSEEQNTPIVYHKNKVKKTDVKKDLTKKFVDAAPTRVITRVRKPTSKLQESLENKSDVVLKSTILAEPITKVDSLNESLKISSDNAKSEHVKETNKRSSKDKIKVNLEQTVAPSKRGRPRKNNETLETSKQVKDEKRESKRKHKETANSSKSLKSNFSIDKTNENNSLETSKTQTEDKISKRQPKRTSKETVSSKNDSKNEALNSSKESTEKNKSIESKVPLNPDPIEPKRSRRTKKEEKIVEETDKKETETRKRTRKQAIKEPSPEKEVRRSKRQKVNNDKMVQPTIKSILKKSVMHEKSAVYNISSESNVDSPNLKRSAEEFSEPNPKRTRSLGNATVTSLRATPARVGKTQKVLFTAFPYEEVKDKLIKLGAVVVTDVMECTVLLTLAIKRTFKLLCAVGLGKPIVGPNWVQACADSNMIVDPSLYLIHDEVAERRFQFSLPRTLAGPRQFLKGVNVSATPNVMPNATEMKLIVECSGGRWRAGGARWVCVSCGADRALWPTLRDKGATIVSTEFVLGGVLRQSLDMDAFQLR